MADHPFIDPMEVRRIAALAYLTLNDEEVQGLTKDLRAILEYVQKLKELEVSTVSATSHAMDLPTQYRDDKIKDSLPSDVALHNAPERLNEGFGVPKIIE